MTTLPSFLEPSSNASACVCERAHYSVTNEDYVCVYDNAEIYPMTHSAIWITYLTLSELFVKVIPSFLLVVLNVWMIQDFNASIRRRRKLKASCFTISKSELFGDVGTEVDEKVTVVKGEGPVEIQGWRQRISSFFVKEKDDEENVSEAKNEESESGIYESSSDSSCSEGDDDVFELPKDSTPSPDTSTTTRGRRRFSRVVLVSAAGRKRHSRKLKERYTARSASRFLPDHVPKMVQQMQRDT